MFSGKQAVVMECSLYSLRLWDKYESIPFCYEVTIFSRAQTITIILFTMPYAIFPLIGGKIIVTTRFLERFIVTKLIILNTSFLQDWISV